MIALASYLEARRAEIEAALERVFPDPPAWPALVADAMRYSLMAGGKRLRPVLVLAAAEAVAVRQGTDPADARRQAMPAACAVEMIHTYSLIHDDLPAMDDDTLRRGRPTLHVVHGEGMAILAGDGLQCEAFALLARSADVHDPICAARTLETIGVLARAAGAAGMVGGQAIDLDAARPGPNRQRATLDAEAITDMHARKTGALIRASAVAGAVMAGAERLLVDAIDRYAAEAGLAFQIVDDILDVEGHADALGKTAGKDAAAGKPTYPSLYGLDGSRARARACLARAEAALAEVGLADSPLTAIARWIVDRTR